MKVRRRSKIRWDTELPRISFSKKQSKTIEMVQGLKPKALLTPELSISFFRGKVSFTKGRRIVSPVRSKKLDIAVDVIDPRKGEAEFKFPYTGKISKETPPVKPMDLLERFYDAVGEAEQYIPEIVTHQQQSNYMITGELAEVEVLDGQEQLFSFDVARGHRHPLFEKILDWKLFNPTPLLNRAFSDMSIFDPDTHRPYKIDARRNRSVLVGEKMYTERLGLDPISMALLDVQRAIPYQANFHRDIARWHPLGNKKLDGIPVDGGVYYLEKIGKPIGISTPTE